MALSTVLTSKPSFKTSIVSLAFHIIPIIPSSSFSSSCKRCRATPFFSLSSETPPLAKKVPFSVSAHGKTWQDPYHWMRNTSDPDFVNYLNQENSYAQAFMADTQNLQQTLVNEMRSRLPTKISTPPERWGPWLYYQYIPEGKEYPVLCRKLENGEIGWVKTILSYASGQFGMEQILLDWNQIAEQFGYVHVGTCRVSPDHNFLAYTLDITGNEQFMLQIKDLRNGFIVPKSEINGVVSLAWAQDGRTLFYTMADENQRPYRVLCTNLGTDNIDDVTVFTESDLSFCVDITSTKDGKFITVNSNSRTSSEVYVIDAINPLEGLQRVHKRVSGVQYFLEHHSGLFYVLTNAPLSGWSGGNYYLATCQIEHIQSSKWQNIILPSEDMNFQDMDIFSGHLVLFLQKKGFPMLCSINLPVKIDCERKMEVDDLDPWFFPLPSNICSIVPGSNHDFSNPMYRVVLSSPVMPDLIVDYDMSKRTFSIVLQEEVRGISDDHGNCLPIHKLHTPECPGTQNCMEKNDQNIELMRWKDFSDAYFCERREVISHDGVRVPLTILYSQKAWQKSLSPGLLQGYGAYGEVLDKSWCPDRLSLLDRGWVMAFADVRGGSGEHSSWHKSGSGLNKLNSIYDFISCGNYLINEGYVHRDRLGAIGFSAGGLLVGSAINMNPKLFRAAILKVPFLDICNTLLDPSLPLTTLDYEEFGNPQIQSQFEYILSYSPYENIPYNGCLPSMLVTASLLDSRVGVWEAAKWVAKLRDITCCNCSSSVILKTNMAGGHFGEGGYYSQCEETAYDYAFLMKIIGNLDDKKSAGCFLATPPCL
ncbi:dipeptidyl aminopeptidase BI isoform X2 [Jatropha curcas]|uniref:dipeptidyl aminopeptidase BI isoform X2 n=1 Tax=Jatropha curcas TaxID=180498 RepID=UPI0005FA9EBB|nr:dipeptidyl aminopeptidase BI isoform X2 [Jatropha curcas]